MYISHFPPIAKKYGTADFLSIEGSSEFESKMVVILMSGKLTGKQHIFENHPFLFVETEKELN